MNDRYFAVRVKLCSPNFYPPKIFMAQGFENFNSTSTNRMPKIFCDDWFNETYNEAENKNLNENLHSLKVSKL